MVLSDILIKKYIREGEIEISPLDDYQIQSSSIDLRLDEHLKVIQPNEVDGSYGKIDFKKPINYAETTRMVVPAKNFVLASTIETIKLSENFCAQVYGRSSVGRAGLIVENAGWIDNGFEGNITLELFNLTNHDIILDEGMRICQIVFEYTGYCERPYGSEELGSKYQGQKGITGSLINLDKEVI